MARNDEPRVWAVRHKYSGAYVTTGSTAVGWSVGKAEAAFRLTRQDAEMWNPQPEYEVVRHPAHPLLTQSEHDNARDKICAQGRNWAERAAMQAVTGTAPPVTAPRPFKVGDRVRHEYSMYGTIVSFCAPYFGVRWDGQLNNTLISAGQLEHLDAPEAVAVGEAESGPIMIDVGNQIAPPPPTALERFDASRPTRGLFIELDQQWVCGCCRKDVRVGDAKTIAASGATCLPCGIAEERRLNRIREGLAAEQAFRDGGK